MKFVVTKCVLFTIDMTLSTDWYDSSFTLEAVLFSLFMEDNLAHSFVCSTCTTQYSIFSSHQNDSIHLHLLFHVSWMRKTYNYFNNSLCESAAKIIKTSCMRSRVCIAQKCLHKNTYKCKHMPAMLWHNLCPCPCPCPALVQSDDAVHCECNSQFKLNVSTVCNLHMFVRLWSGQWTIDWCYMLHHSNQMKWPAFGVTWAPHLSLSLSLSTTCLPPCHCAAQAFCVFILYCLFATFQSCNKS